MFKKSMFKKIGLASAFLGILLISTTANAIVIEDTISQNIFLTGILDSHSYTHDLTDDGFITGATTAISGMLTIQFSDDGGFLDFELIGIVIEALDLDSDSIIFSASAFSDNLEVNALAELNSDGMLDVTITSLLGDFFIGDSVLSINAVQAPAPPVLGILALGCLSIFAAGGIRKTRRI